MITNHFFITSSDIRYSLSIRIYGCKRVISVNFFYLSTINKVSFNNKIICILFIHTFSIIPERLLLTQHNCLRPISAHREKVLKHSYCCIDGAGS